MYTMKNNMLQREYIYSMHVVVVVLIKQVFIVPDPSQNLVLVAKVASTNI